MVRQCPFRSPLDAGDRRALKLVLALLPFLVGKDAPVLFTIHDAETLFEPSTEFALTTFPYYLSGTSSPIIRDRDDPLVIKPYEDSLTQLILRFH